MDKKNIKVLEEIEAVRSRLPHALQGLCDTYGFTVKAGSVSYTADGNFTMKVDFTKNGAATKEEKHYELNRATFGLPPFGTEVTMVGEKFVICGLNATGTKVVLKKGGRKYMSGTTSVVNAMAQNKLLEGNDGTNSPESP